MKKLFVVFISVIFNANLFAGCLQKDPLLTRTFPAASIKSVEVNTSGGSITVSGNDAREAVVEVYVSRDKWSAEKIKQSLDENYTIDINVSGGKLNVSAKSKKTISNWNLNGLNISVKISIPRQVSSNLHTSGGSIHISNLTGAQDIRTSGGSLTIDDVSGNITGKTSGGSISISNSNDKINLTTSGGSIIAKDCNGKISLNTSGGSIRMNGISGDVNASTSGGSITADQISGTLKTGTSGGSISLNAISGSLEAHTSGGSINVTMESVSDYVKLSNSGSIHLTIPINRGYHLKLKGNKVETTGLKDFRGSMDSKNVSGTVAGGGAEIEIRSSHRVAVTLK